MFWLIYSLSLFVDCLAQIALAIFKRLFCDVNALRSILASLLHFTLFSFFPVFLGKRLGKIVFLERWWRLSLKGNADKYGFKIKKISFNQRLRNVSVLSALQIEFRKREVLWIIFSLSFFLDEKVPKSQDCKSFTAKLHI